MSILLAILVAVLPTYTVRFGVFGLPSTLLEVLILGLFGWWVWMKAEERKSGRAEIIGNKPRSFERVLTVLRAWRWPIGLFLLASVLAVLVAPDKLAALGLWRAYFLEPLMVFVVGVDVMKTAADRRRVVWGLAGLAVVIGLIALVQYFTGYGIPAPWTDEAGRRVTAMFGYPNAVGLLMAPVGVVCVGMVVKVLGEWFFKSGKAEKRKSGKWELMLMAAAGVAAVLSCVLAQSEGALAGMAMGFFILGVGTKWLRKMTLAGAVAAMVVGVAVTPLREYLVKLLTFQDWSGTVRRVMWKETLVMLGDHPIVGAGLSGYRAVMENYHLDKNVEIFMYPHNLVLNFWSELGILGLVAFGWLVVVIAWLLWRQRGTANAGMALVIGAALAAHLFHGLVDVPYFKNDLAVLWWVLVAMAWSLELETKVAKAA